MKKERLDDLLLKQGFFHDRKQAQRFIMAGLVLVNKDRVDKPGTRVPTNAKIELKTKKHAYVSRGGLKLEEALHAFPINLKDKVMLDIGASTGGFTDCALQNEVKIVYAIDVAYGQLAWKLRQDPRVIVMERTNFRYLEPNDLKGETPNFATIDVSFISLANILPKLYNLLEKSCQVVALVKPQFEASREEVETGGIVKDPIVHKKVLINFIKLAYKVGFDVLGLVPSPILGTEGNIEFLAYLVKSSSEQETKNEEIWERKIEEVVNVAHQRFNQNN